MRTINSLPYLPKQKFCPLFSGFVSIFSIQNSKNQNFLEIVVNRSIFSLSGLDCVYSNVIFNPLYEDGQFEDVSQIKNSFCWKYFLLDKINHKAKCNVKISEGEYCNRVYSAQDSATTSLKYHLKRRHGIF